MIVDLCGERPVLTTPLAHEKQPTALGGLDSRGFRFPSGPAVASSKTSSKVTP